MSKTFEALQRAALEKEARLKEKVTAPPEPVVEQTQVDPVIEVPNPQADFVQPEVTPTISSEDQSGSNQTVKPLGDEDSGLTALLKQHLCLQDDSVLVESDGWVRGRIGEEAATALLKCYALLHCLRQDQDNWFWFWASSADAQERARRCSYPLDLACFD